MRSLPFADLPEDIQHDVLEAENQLAHAFPPTHTVKVGAVLRADGKQYAGANIRRRGFSSSTCAERFVLDAALHNGAKKIERLVALVSTSTDSLDVKGCGPCGLCRQQYIEALDMLGQQDMPIYFTNEKKQEVIETTLSELLPCAYRKPEGKN